MFNFSQLPLGACWLSSLRSDQQSSKVYFSPGPALHRGLVMIYLFSDGQHAARHWLPTHRDEICRAIAPSSEQWTLLSSQQLVSRRNFVSFSNLFPPPLSPRETRAGHTVIHGPAIQESPAPGLGVSLALAHIINIRYNLDWTHWVRPARTAHAWWTSLETSPG